MNKLFTNCYRVLATPNLCIYIYIYIYKIVYINIPNLISEAIWGGFPYPFPNVWYFSCRATRCCRHISPQPEAHGCNKREAELTKLLWCNAALNNVLSKKDFWNLLHSLKLTFSPLKIGLLPQKETSNYSNHPWLQVRSPVSFREVAHWTSTLACDRW